MTDFNSQLCRDKMEAGSVKYLYKPLLFIRLGSGNLAICNGLGARELIAIIPAEGSWRDEAEKVWEFIDRAATQRTASTAEHRSAVTTREGSLDLSTLDFGDL